MLRTMTDDDLLTALEEYEYGEKKEFAPDHYKSIAIHMCPILVETSFCILRLRPGVIMAGICSIAPAKKSLQKKKIVP